MASSFDAKRFGGPIGHILLQDQERVLAEFLGDVSGRRILDMATGTGRAALALAKRGAIVTGVDASREMLSVARTRAADAGLSIEFAEGDAHALAFPDRVVRRGRVPAHADARAGLAQSAVGDCAAWRASAGLRLSRRSAAPPRYRRCGAAPRSPWDSNVEAYRVFRAGDVARELDRHGFRITSTHKQFVLPIALHKAVGSAGFTRGLEGVLAGAGMLRLAGSPVTIAAERCAS